MYVSNEPGFYKAGEFGMRIESDLVVVEASTEFAFGARKWLEFDYLTMVPMSRSLVDTSLLSEAEITWLDSYHQKVYAVIAPRLREQKNATTMEGEVSPDLQVKWLAEATAPFGSGSPK
jgi:Xaa-Pro aminopeptidase